MKKSSLLFFSLFLCISFLHPQTTVLITASADNTIYQNPANNSNALGQNIFSGTNGGGSPRRGLIRFDIAAVVPANAIITSVSLTLNCNLSRSVPDNVSLHKVLSSWGEGTSNAGSVSDGQGIAATANDATWQARFFPSTLWATPGGDFTVTPSASIGINSTGFFQWSTADMATDVQAWLTVPASNFGWILICDESAASTSRKFGSRENAVIANRPSLSVTYTTTLPVTLSYFNAIQKNRAALLRWETLQEFNNRYFEILHSRDGINYSVVAIVNGQGTSSMKHEYNFTHTINAQGSHFYQLAQVDFDGRRKYSGVEKLNLIPDKTSIALFPNPATDQINLSGADFQNCIYEIVNQNGTVLIAGTLNSGSVKIDRLTAGIYYVCIYVNKELIGRQAFFKIW